MFHGEKDGTLAVGKSYNLFFYGHTFQLKKILEDFCKMIFCLEIHKYGTQRQKGTK